jgi:hypothetical protein
VGRVGMIKIADFGLRIADCGLSAGPCGCPPKPDEGGFAHCGLGIDRQLPFKFPLNAEGIDVHY